MAQLAGELVNQRQIALWCWERLYGEPYRWGGNDPLEGFDCSGLVVEGLKSAGLLPREGDWTAAALATRFPVVAGGLKPGCLLFYRRGEAIGHVEIVWLTVGSLVFTLAASGGGSATVDRSAAQAQNAYVKIRPAVSPWFRAVDPFAGVPE